MSGIGQSKGTSAFGRETLVSRKSLHVLSMYKAVEEIRFETKIKLKKGLIFFKNGEGPGTHL